MNTSMSDLSWHTVMKFFTLSALSIPLVLVLILLIPTDRVAAQPTLKEVLEKAVPEEDETPKSTAAIAEAVKPETTKSDSAPAPTTNHIPQDELDRGVPRKSIRGFLETAHERDFEQAAEYLDLRNLPGNIKNIPGSELARQLYIVLTRSLLIDHELLSMDPQGHLDDGLPMPSSTAQSPRWRGIAISIWNATGPLTSSPNSMCPCC